MKNIFIQTLRKQGALSSLMKQGSGRTYRRKPRAFYPWLFIVGYFLLLGVGLLAIMVKTKTEKVVLFGNHVQISGHYPSLTQTLVPTSDLNKGEHEYYPDTPKRRWGSNWENGRTRNLKSGQWDPYDNEFVVRGNGTVQIDGKGIAAMSGESPRMYVYDKTGNKKWKNVEIVVYAKRISETGIKSSQGIVIGARSEHQDVTESTPCRGRTYYGRLLYDGRAVFQKELIHDEAYSSNKPSENNKVKWSTPDGTIPKNVWIGVKFIVKTISQNSVKLELYRDMTEGANGGNWEKVAEYVDNGGWSQTDTSVDIEALCGYSANEVILSAGTSIFIRNDEVQKVQYKNFRITEIL